MTSMGLEMPPDQKAFQMASTCDLIGPVINGATYWREGVPMEPN